MKSKVFKYITATVVIVLIGWGALTIYVEKKGPLKKWQLGNGGNRKALIVYDPDPFYNLDEQVCLAFGKALAEHQFAVTVASVAATDSIDRNTYHLIVYCANTYNWRPDWSITSYVKQNSTATHAPVVAITLGAGSTGASKTNFEHIIRETGATLAASYTLWLWRPNDEQQLEQPNVNVAVALAHEWGNQIANTLN